MRVLPLPPGMVRLSLLFTAAACSLFGMALGGEDFHLHTFSRQQLTDTYYSEGASAGDIDGDGKMDIVHGPYWFAGPDFKTPHEIYPAKAQNKQGYSDSFFSWVYDFDGDEHNDVLFAGFPGTPAMVLKNPGPKGLDKPWEKFTVLDQVANEAPQFVNVVGDERPELLCTHDGFYGYATISDKEPLGAWTYHIVSEKVAAMPFGHGLGAGDVNGDGKQDILAHNGWYEQPAELKEGEKWPFHEYEFTAAGGAEMYAYDVDGDGDNDVITSLQAHAFGLAWFEQIKEGDAITFRPHVIMGEKAEDSPYGVLFTELHSVALVDMDGDGLKDIVTGKTYWSHHTSAPMWDAGAVVYWFKLTPGKVAGSLREPSADLPQEEKKEKTADGTRSVPATEVEFVPMLADGEAGIGRQISIADVNADKLPDIVVGGMKGAHVLLHKQEKVSKEKYEAAQPQRRKEMADGLSPKAAAAHMTVPPGFRVQLAAGEPQVHQPIAFTIDPRGRLWVAEAYTYPIRAEQGEGKDKIVILEDADGDGEFESRKVFCEGLNLVSGLELGFGGVYVGAPPYLMFIPDQNGDDVPDGPSMKAEPKPGAKFPKDVPPGATVLLDGWGWEDTHETLNSFIWGPDGWLYGCHGVFTRSNVGKPGAKDDERTPLNAGVWRYHPTKHVFEVFAHGSSNPWGVDFDDHGQAFITACVIPHLYHVIPGGRYQRQSGEHFNPYTFDDIKTIADHAHYTGNIADHAWWGHEPHAPSDTLAAGGGHAHCGAMIYLGDNWPDEYRGRLFMNNIHGNRVNCDILEPAGSGFVGRHGKDLLIANDRWYRGISLKYGPDGSVYISDWYDKNACHRNSPEIWDRKSGRIYNVAYVANGGPMRFEGDLSKLSDKDLVELHLHKNDWYVRMARRLLQERKAEGAIDLDAMLPLLEIFVRHEDETRRLRALWTAHTMGALSNPDIHESYLNGAKGEQLRRWIVRLEVEASNLDVLNSSDLSYLAEVTESPVMRLEIAATLQRLRAKDRWDIATALLSHAEDANDHNLPLMIWYAVEPLVAADPARAMTLAKAAKIPLVQRFIVRRAAAENDLLPHAVALLDESTDVPMQQLILDEMLRAFEGRVGIPMPESWTPAYEKLVKSEDAAIRERADQIAVILGDKRIFPRMRGVLLDQNAAAEERRKALDILIRGRDKESVAAYQQVLGDPALRAPALKALAGFDDENTPVAVLERYASFSAEERGDAIATLTSRPPYAFALLDAMENENIPRTDLHAYHVRQLLSFKNEELSNRLKEVWGEIRESSGDKQKLIAEFSERLAPDKLQGADLSHGRAVFAKTCANCHVLFGEGGKVGPDITGSNRANLQYLLENVLDPSAVLGKDYRMTVVSTQDGGIVQGLVQKETDSALTVRTLNDTVVVAKADILERQLSELSMMPDNLLDVLKADEVRDLVAYLGSPAQVALRGPSAPIDAETGLVPGAIEGETMKVLAKSDGAAGGQNMGEFRADRWSGMNHLWWTGAGPGAKLELELPVENAGRHRLEIVMTKARDYGIVQLSLDDMKLGGPLDLYNNPEVITTGVLEFDLPELTAGKHRLVVEILGANPQAAKAYMFGLDYVRVVDREVK